ncbi:MAG: hypothetical protein ISR78_01965 [Spirochaetia bacterium]|nr:hypothetical protein [Spirochaetia bacterium]
MNILPIGNFYKIIDLDQHPLQSGRKLVREDNFLYIFRKKWLTPLIM